MSSTSRPQSFANFFTDDTATDLSVYYPSMYDHIHDRAIASTRPTTRKLKTLLIIVRLSPSPFLHPFQFHPEHPHDFDNGRPFCLLLQPSLTLRRQSPLATLRRSHQYPFASDLHPVTFRRSHRQRHPHSLTPSSEHLQAQPPSM